jgi:mono/diheme cytochrome c family protein
LNRSRNKSLAAAFSAEKEDVFFFEKKNQKKTFGPALLRAGLSVFTLVLAEPAVADDAVGAAIFNERCALCHQADGHGAPGVAPSLAGTLAQYTGSADGVRYLSQIVVSGMVGKIRTEGHGFSGLMPGFAADLGDAQIASVVDYVLAHYNAVANPPVTAESVAAARAAQPVPTDTRHLREKLLAASK